MGDQRFANVYKLERIVPIQPQTETLEIQRGRQGGGRQIGEVEHTTVLQYYHFKFCPQELLSWNVCNHGMFSPWNVCYHGMFSPWNVCYHGTFSSWNVCFHGTFSPWNVCFHGTFSPWNVCFHGTFSPWIVCYHETFSPWNVCYHGTFVIMERLAHGSFVSWNVWSIQRFVLRRLCIKSDVVSQYRTLCRLLHFVHWTLSPRGRCVLFI